jgi:hypothetical protein
VQKEVPTMLDAFPIYHWFHNGNPYSGAEGGMRYVITPIKVPDPSNSVCKNQRFGPGYG